MPRVLFLSQLAAPGAPWRELLGCECDWIAPVFASLGASVIAIDATTASRLPSLAELGPLDGVVVGGSVGSANDTEPWRTALRAWLLAHLDAPFFGICGGHQLLAHALGAPIHTLPAPQRGAWGLGLSGVPGFRGRVLQMHQEHVAALPPGAELWAEDAVCHQAYRYGPLRWTTQFHPEAELEGVLQTFTHLPDDERSASIAAGGDLSRGAVAEAIDSGREILRAWLAALPREAHA